MPALRYITKELAAVEVFGQPVTFSANLANLSETGACLEWASDGSIQLQKGDLLRVTVALSKINKTHNLNAEVVWIAPNKTGIQFIKNDELIDKMIGRSHP